MTTTNHWDNAETIALAGDCRECARFAWGGGYKDPACERHVYEHRMMSVEVARAAFAGPDADAKLEVAKHLMSLWGGTNCVANDLWAVAMTLRYGPTGLHPSRADAEGRPLPQTLEMPAVRRAMERAAERLPALLDTLERDARDFGARRGVA